MTDEQRSSRPIFNATLRAAAGWLFFRVARSTRMPRIWALRSRLEKRPTDLRRTPRHLGDSTLTSARNQVPGFTILEVCVVLFIIAVMFSIGVPTASHLLDEEKLQGPIRELQTFARTARRHALMENRAYEVLLLNDSYILQPVDNNSKDADRKPITYGLPSGVTFVIERLGDHGFLKQTDSTWYFSPNGLCEPMKFLFQREGDWVRFHVDPLTGTMEKDGSYIQ